MIVARGVELVVLDQRLADGLAHRLEERVGHGAADEQRVHARHQVLDHLDLVRHLGAAQDGDERPLRVLERLAEVAELLLHQQAGAGLPASACTSASTEACARCAAPNASFT